MKYQPIRHNHAAFIAKAAKREGFTQAYAALALRYATANQELKTRMGQNNSLVLGRSR